MTHKIASTLAVVAALAFPAIALADASGTQTLSANTSFAFDTSTVVTSGTAGDMRFSGTEIQLVGSGTAYNFG